jgi:UDP-N-acetylglucosamine 2-epimerase (non-hydrolysing)
VAEKIRIMIVMGTRPEAIKLAPVVRELESSDRHRVEVIVTAQHRELLDQVLRVFDIRPVGDLNVMQTAQDLHDVTARVVVGLRDVIHRDRCDLLLVQGDTTTVFAAALAAFYAGVAVGHVEAGLRTGDKTHPFPEEINRRLATVLTDLHFAPTPAARDNLLAEGVASQRIHVTGNTAIDALLWTVERIKQKSYPEVEEVRSLIGERVGERRMVLITAHRRESFGQPLRDICGAVRTLAERQADVHWVYPVHLNPNVRGPVHEILGKAPNIHLLAPQSYPAFVWLMQRSSLILTDSGGIQEEAPSLGKPVLVMRETTERPEGVACGAAILVGRDPETIVETVSKLLASEGARERPAGAINPYGDGQASRRIAAAIDRYFRSRDT